MTCGNIRKKSKYTDLYIFIYSINNENSPSVNIILSIRDYVRPYTNLILSFKILQYP